MNRDNPLFQAVIRKIEAMHRAAEFAARPLSTFAQPRDLCDRSEKNLKGLHPALVRVIRRASTFVAFREPGHRQELPPSFHHFVVIDGKRSAELQRQYYESGKSRTLDSYHLTGHAADIAAFDGAGNPVWRPWSIYADLAESMMQAAHMEGVPLQWGGHFARQNELGVVDPFRDGVHFQIPRAVDMFAMISDAEMMEEIARRAPEIEPASLAALAKKKPARRKKAAAAKKDAPSGQKSAESSKAEKPAT